LLISLSAEPFDAVDIMAKPYATAAPVLLLAAAALLLLTATSPAQAVSLASRRRFHLCN
jgi:hypothetical protein